MFGKKRIKSLTKSKGKVSKIDKNIVRRGENSNPRGYVLSNAKASYRSHFSGLRVTFLGTSSAKTTRTRNVTSIVVESEKSTWMFDCGDGTQRQLLHTHFPKAKLECIFITHLHGDHCFGLPSVICSLLFMDSTIEKLNIYGPVGLYDLIYKSLSTTCSIEFIWKRVAIYEFVDTKSNYQNNNNNNNSDNNSYKSQKSNIYVPFKGAHAILENESYTVHVARIEHTVNSFGFVIEEKSMPGRIDVDLLNKYNVPSSRIRSELKECFKAGNDLRKIFPFPEDADLSRLVAPNIVGRKIVLLGDTSDPSNIADKGLGCDLLIHEATFEAAEELKAIKCKHSSTRMAGKVASLMQAKNLCITHFSVRYRKQDIPRLVEEASELYKEGDIIAAKDFLSIDILPLNDKPHSHGFDRKPPKVVNAITQVKSKLIKKKSKHKSKLKTAE
jgi:ribonuclease Z